MTKTLTIEPRFADYKNMSDAAAAFLANKDFTSCGMGSYGLAVCMADCREQGIERVTIRYSRQTKAVVIDVPQVNQ
jgi:hypothetical protein